MNAVKLGRRIAGCVIAGCAVGIPVHAQSSDSRDNDTRTPIKHVVYIIGENRSFDHVYGTYQAPAGQTVWNILSEGIVNADGTPGPNFAKAQQWQASQPGNYSIHPTKTTPFATLPDINTDGAPTNPPFSNIWTAHAVEPSLWFESYYRLVTGGTGLPGDVVDTRFPAGLPNGPFNISRWVSYNDYTSSPVHRFYQNIQQLDCDITKATKRNPSGCQADLFPWTEITQGAGQNGNSQPAGFNDESTGEGATSMGFWNVAAGDAPYFTSLANEYAISDNFHQAFLGGTGANHIILGFGTGIYYADANGNPTTPPSNQIENPNSQPGTNNYWVQDGYSGGSYINCADSTQPGVAAWRDYEKSLPYKVFRNGDCKKGAYYLVNNYNPGYLGTGVAAPLGAQVFTVPPSRQRNIGLVMSENHVSWHYYGEGWAQGSELGENGTYCNICNPFLYSTQIMTNPKLRANLQDIQNLYSDITNGTLPAVSIVKPDGYMDGHPASSKWDLYEGFVKKIVQMIQANPKLFANTAIFITQDEAGGYWDSGYVQPLDFFGDGTRMPLIVVSPFSKGVGVVHAYGDHVSFDKFVERNWGLPTIAADTRDNLPTPITTSDNPYAPVNAPAITDFFPFFHFHQ
jgi:phospholipase C